MRYIKLFEKYNDIDSICERYSISNYSINDDGTIDVNGDVEFDDDDDVLDRIPLRFNRVSGSFICYNNKLTSLEGCPKYVGSNFDCGYNELTTLKFCPTYVGAVLYVTPSCLTEISLRNRLLP